MSAEKVELIAHPLCAFAQRALYAASFKSIPAQITFVNLRNPEPWFLEANPLGEVPVARVTRNGHTLVLTESLNVAEYFDSFPGPALYPRLENGSVDPLLKGLIDVFIKLKVGRFVSAYYTVHSASPSEEEAKEFEDAMTEMCGFVENGDYVMTKVIGRNEFTFADLIMLSHTERLWLLKDKVLPQLFARVDLTNLWKWYERVSSQAWAQEHKTNPVWFGNAMKNIFAEGGYNGYELPLSKYDD
jgi:glutathione S-transferase